MAKLAEIANVLKMAESQMRNGNLTLSKGVFTRRVEYYWSPKSPPEAFFSSLREELINAGYVLSSLEYGDVWKTFKGGGTVKQNSHYWMKFKATKANA